MMGSRLAALGLSYLVGSFPTAYVLVKYLKHADIRTIGSGNVGSTNVTRAAGFKVGLVVFLLDALKGVVAVKIIAAHWFFGDSTMALLCGAVAVIGHVAPVWLGFRGGKGVATAIGMLASAMPFVAMICLVAWWVVFLLWRYVSLASLTAMVVMPLAQCMMRQPPAQVLIGAGLAALILVKHRANISRLLKGIEDKWKSKKS